MKIIIFHGLTFLFVCRAWIPPQEQWQHQPPQRSWTNFPPGGSTRTRLDAKKPKKSAGSSNSSSDVVVALLYSHHLLDHKPDNLILKGGKHKLRGMACLGRPGVALCIGPSRSLQKFRSALESAMPQKRFKTKILKDGDEEIRCCDDIRGFERAESLGDFRAVLASIGEEDEFFALTGIPPGNGGAQTEGRDEGQSGYESKTHRKRKR